MRIPDLQQLLIFASDSKCTIEKRAEVCAALKKEVLPTYASVAFRLLIEEIFKRPDQIANSAFVLCLLCGDPPAAWQPHMLFAIVPNLPTD